MIRKGFFDKIVSSSSAFRSVVLVARFTSATSPAFHCSAAPHSLRARDEDSKNVRVSVWWDFENCHVPVGVNVLRVAQIITAAVRANGIKGPVQISAFGDVFQLSRANQLALSMTGVNISHIPRGGKNSADRSLLVDLMYWVSQNPPPAHLFLISGDSDFASILHRLRMNNYNILLACNDTAPSVLYSAASIMWQWNALIKEEKLIGRHFNQPPDGPYGSWYGHYRVPLENPFSVEEQHAETEETCNEVPELNTSSVPKIRPVPPAVLKQLRHILSLHPRGIPITEFRTQLMKCNVGMEKDYYGYKKLSRFLLSMPHIVKLKNTDDGLYIVDAKSSLSGRANGCTSPSKVINNQEPHDIESLSPNKSERVKRLLHPSAEPDVKQHAAKIPSPSIVEDDIKEGCANKVQEPHTVAEAMDVIKAQVDEGVVTPSTEHASGSNSGTIKRIWKRLFPGGDRSQVTNPGSSEKLVPSGNGNKLDKKGESTSEDHEFSTESIEREKNDSNVQKKHSQDKSFAESVMDNKPDKSSEACGSRSPRLLARIGSWFRSWSRPIPNKLDDQPREDMQQQKLGVFSEDSFWKDIESFILTPEGSLVISQSTMREQIAQKLKKQGPSAVRSLNDKDALRLVDLLISEKRWVEESDSTVSPFKLTLAMDTSSGGPSASYNQLSSMFSRLGSESKRNPNEGINSVHDAEISPPVRHSSPAQKSRTDILLDCQKLLDEILKEFPDGYNMGSFKKLFHDRYGYQLNIEKLGYKKMASLLQIMPGVRIEFNMIFPATKTSKTLSQDIIQTITSSDSELSNLLQKDDESDSLWEELGPVDDTSEGRNKAMEEVHITYEPSVSDDSFSDSDWDSEGESSCSTTPVAQTKPKAKEEDSSLLQILDSWYGHQEGENRAASVSGKVNNPANGMPPAVNKTETSSGPHGQPPRPQKRYSFVADPVVDNKDKLIDGILGSLKKSSDSGIQA